MKRLIAIFIIAAAAMPAAPAPAQDAPNLRRTNTVMVVQKTKDAVVNVSTTKVINERLNPFGGDPFFEQFDFGSRRVPAMSLGSGFIIHPDGYVVTNYHVIDRARQITVELADGRKLPAELISSDPDADLAILNIKSDKPLPALELGDSSDLMIGEPVIAVGNPLGYSHSVSTGIVSAIHRDLKDSQDHVILGDLIQTDAAINPGNSGGPLLNAYGQVIAINTAIRGDAQNIGFAIQVNKLRDLIPELMNPAQVTKLEMPLQLKEERRLQPPATVEASVCRAGAGGATVKSIAGRRPRDIVDAYAILLAQKADQKFIVEFSHGPSLEIVPRPAPLPDAMVQARKKLGITIEPLTPMLAEKYGLNTEDGMFITAVQRDSAAARAGLEAGDVIVQLGRYRISTLDDFAATLQHLQDDSAVRVGVVRGDHIGFGILKF